LFDSAGGATSGWWHAISRRLSQEVARLVWAQGEGAQSIEELYQWRDVVRVLVPGRADRVLDVRDDRIELGLARRENRERAERSSGPVVGQLCQIAAARARSVRDAGDDAGWGAGAVWFE
jgi:hypothetical protein